MIYSKEEVLFDQWIGKKKELNFKKGALNFKEREIFWCALGHNIGDEENEKNLVFSRPVLILKKFNKNLFWGITLTTKIKDNPYYIKFSFKDMDQSAMITHLRLFDSKRLCNKLSQLNLSDFIRIKDSIKNCL